MITNNARFDRFKEAQSILMLHSPESAEHRYQRLHLQHDSRT